MSDIKTVKRSLSLMDCEIVTNVPATAEGYDSLHPSGEGSCVADAVTTGIYRGYANAVRSAIAKAIIALTQVAKRPDAKKVNAKNEPVLESDDSYVTFIRDTGVLEAAKIQSIANDVVDELPYTKWLADSSNSAGGNVGKEYIELAQGLLDKWKLGTSSPEFTSAKFATLLPGTSVAEDISLEELARIVKRYMSALKANALA